MKEESKFKLFPARATAAWRMAEKLAAKQIPVIVASIDGKRLDLTNHQTEFYEFYKKKYGIE